MPEAKNYNAAIYARLSKEDDRAGDSVSIEAQVDMLTKFAVDKGWNIKKEYKDDGCSGTSFDRPAFNQMMSDIRNGEINLVLVKDLSRFGRDYLEVGNYTDIIFPSLGCRFIAVNDNVDTINKNNDMLAIFKNVMNDFYARDTSAKIRAVRKSSCRMGKYVGAFAPYGYAKDPKDHHKFIIDETAADVVRNIFAMHAEGMGCLKIAKSLNEKDIMPPRAYYYNCAGKSNPFTRTNGKWNSHTIRSILNNEVYLGHTVQHKEERFSYKDHRQIPVPHDEWIKVENTHEPIISSEMWEACRRIDRMYSKPHQSSLKEISMFSGLLFCADCGCAMRCQVKNQKRADGTTAHYEGYMCGSYSRSGHTACTAHYITLNTLSELVFSDIQAWAYEAACRENEIVRMMTERMQKQGTQKTAAMEKSAKMLKKRLAELDKLLLCTYEDKVLGKIAEEICVKLMSKYHAEQAEKKEQLEKLEKELAANRKVQEDVTEWIGLIRQYRNSNILDRNMLLSLVDRIEVGEVQRINGQKERKIKIHYKFVGDIG